MQCRQYAVQEKRVSLSLSLANSHSLLMRLLFAPSSLAIFCQPAASLPALFEGHQQAQEAV